MNEQKSIIKTHYNIDPIIDRQRFDLYDSKGQLTLVDITRDEIFKFSVENPFEKFFTKKTVLDGSV